MIRVRVVVSGQVQGVFFRVATHEEATKRGVAGWVRNVPGDGVEAVFEGPEAAVEEMIAWCREGPPLAAVDEVEVSRESPEGLSGFRIRA